MNGKPGVNPFHKNPPKKESENKTREITVLICIFFFNIHNTSQYIFITIGKKTLCIKNIQKFI